MSGSVRAVLTAFLGIWVAGMALGQSRSVDKLERQLTSVQGPARVDVLNQLARKFASVDDDKALMYHRQALTLSRQIDYKNGEAQAYTIVSARYAQRHQPDSQLYYLEQAVRLRRLLPDKAQLFEALVSKIRVSMAMNEFTGAEASLREAEATIAGRPADDESRNDLRHLKAIMRFYQGRFGEADALADSARNYFFQKSLFHKYVSLLIDLGQVFAERDEHELALGYLFDAGRMSDTHHLEDYKATIMIRIGWIYRELGSAPLTLRLANSALASEPDKLQLADRASAMMLKGVVLTDMARYDSARTTLESVWKIYTGVGSIHGQSEVLLRRGTLESREGKYEAALKDYQESARLAETIAYDYVRAWSYWGQGDVYLKLKQYRHAENALSESLKYSGRVGWNDLTVLNYNTRRDVLAAQGRLNEALAYAVRADNLRDSVHKRDVERQFVNMEKIREIERQERDIQMLQTDKQLTENKLALQEARINQQSLMIVAGTVVLVLLIGVVALYYRFYNRIKTLNVSITGKNEHILAQSRQLTDANQELKKLYQEVSDQKEEIQIQADKLAESNRSMGDVNHELENLVLEKTAELKRTNDELIKYNHELLQFSYTVSHNLRGPVARLLGLADLAAREKEVIESRQMIGLIGHTAHDLDLIIKDLSNILELRNNPHRQLETVRLEQEWQQSKTLLQESLTGDEQIVINFKALPEIRIVRPMLQSIFYNLLSNAIKYRSPERPLQVTATSRSENGYAILDITDNGLGFNISLHNENLFKLYRRFHTHVQGRGLGLYLIKTQVDVLQGTIEVASEPDKGSTFKVILPLRHEDETYT
jgi:signal transduction histidine kinase